MDGPSSMKLPPLRLNETPAFPRCLEIQTTNVCNARCKVCPYARTTAHEPKQRMDDGTLYRVLAECADHRDQMEWIIPYLNNEPFADPRILEVLKYIRANVGVPVEVSTNGSLVTEERARVVVEERLIQNLRVSLFGMTEHTYQQRMEPLRWSVTCENISRLLELRNATECPMNVEIIVVETADLGATELRMGRDMWQPLGATVRVFGYLDRAGNNELRNLLPMAQATGRLCGCELNRPFERMAIRCSGDCVLCSQDWRGNVRLGTVCDESILAIWQSERYQVVRGCVSGAQHAPDAFLCRKCKLAYVE